MKSTHIKIKKRTSTSSIFVVSLTECIEYNNLISEAKNKYYQSLPESNGNLNQDVLRDQAKAGEYPHMALIGYNSTDPNESRWSCAGSIISMRFILTAAQCLTFYVLVLVIGNLHNNVLILLLPQLQWTSYPCPCRCFGLQIRSC